MAKLPKVVKPAKSNLRDTWIQTFNNVEVLGVVRRNFPVEVFAADEAIVHSKFNPFVAHTGRVDGGIGKPC